MNRGVAVVAVLVPALATADPDHFVMLDRQDDSSRAGAEVSLVGAALTLRSDLHAQYVMQDAIGAYISAPIGYGNGGGAHLLGLGDVELGGIYSPHLSPTAELSLHVGITLPTLSATDRNGFNVLQATIGPRIVDLYQAAPAAVTLRLGVSPIIKSGRVFLRADLGADVGLSAPQGYESVMSPLPNVFHANVGLGVDLDRAAVMLESANVYINYVGGYEPWRNTAALSARFDGGFVSPYAAIVLGLDSRTRYSMEEALTVGLDAKLR